MTGVPDSTTRRHDGAGSSAAVHAAGNAPRRATGADAALVAALVTAILVEAFGEDPMWGAWAFPDPATRRQYRGLVFGLLVEGALRYPWVWVSADNAATALWIPPGAEELSPDQEQEIDAVLHASLGDRADAVLHAFESFEAARPVEPHYYLTLLGTDPRRGGHGIGGRLLRSSLETLDAEESAAYLEAADELVSFYERFGFRRLTRFELDAGLTVNGMWRDPRPTTDRSSGLTDV